MKTETDVNGTNVNGDGAGSAGNTGALSGIVGYSNDDLKKKNDGSKHCFALISPPTSPGECSDRVMTDMFCSVGRAELSVKDIGECLKAVKKVADAENVWIICLNADCIAGYGHIESAVFHAKRSWYEDKPIANSFEMEVLLYTGARRQCNEIGEFGLHKGNNDLFVCVCREMKNKTADENGKLAQRCDEHSAEYCSEYFEMNEKVFSELEREISLKSMNGSEFDADETDKTDKEGKADKADNEAKSDKISDKKLKKLMKLFDIPDEELSEVGIGRIEELIVEKVALLDIQK
ncbi:MAG: hypothetical protein II861_06090 [Methanomicrobium sp.]|nr:hypothetical protein [Methanomicrobium sp.]